MKRILGTVAAITVGASMMFSAGLAAAKDLLMATDTAFVPFEFKQGDRYVGFDIDLWDAVAKEIGVTYKIQPMDFNGIIPALQTNNVDVALAGISIKEERKKAVDFSDGYYDSGITLMVSNDSVITGVQDLKGKKLALKTGTVAADYAKANLKETELVQFPNIDNAYLELASGRVDAVLHDTPNILYYAITAGKGKVKAVGPQMLAQPYGMAFPKNSPLVPKANAALSKIKADGRYKEIYVKWFGVEPK